MGATTEIGWADATFNPIGGCSIESPGCRFCYAQRIAGSPRLENHPLYKGVTTPSKAGPVFNGKLTVAPDDHPIWTWPIRWRGSKYPKAGAGQPSMIFVGDMSDLFHEDRPTAVIDKVVASIIYSKHIGQLLTKRSRIMMEYFTELKKSGRWLDFPHPLFGKPNFDPAVADYENVFSRLWLGISAEDQPRWDERYRDLFETPAAVRFASFEPLLGRIDPCEALGMWWNQTMGTWEGSGQKINRDKWGNKRLNWAITGGESGPDYRPVAHMQHFETLQRCCAAANVKFFFKQDSSFRSGIRGRASDELWACKEFPVGPPPGEMAGGAIHEPGTNGETDPDQGELL